MKRKTVGNNWRRPHDAVIAAEPEHEKRPETTPVLFRLDTELVERLRNAAYWTPGLTLVSPQADHPGSLEDPEWLHPP